MLVTDFIRYSISRAFDRGVSPTSVIPIEPNFVEKGSEPSVTIVIPTRDKLHLLKQCVDSIQVLTDYSNYEIVILNNQSRETATLEYMSSISEPNIRVLDFDEQFNFSKLCNFGAESSKSDFLCFLNNDTKILSGEWLREMVGHGLEKTSGVVGALLTFEDGSIQHSGLALGYRGIAGHIYSGFRGTRELPNNLGGTCFRTSAVTFACALISRGKYMKLGGLDEKFQVGLNDVDFCIRATKAGLVNLVCSQSRLMHFESQSRKSVFSLSGGARAMLEILKFLKKHPFKTLKDPYFASRRFR